MAEYTIDKIEYGGNVYKLQDGVSPAAGITATDISNWNAKVSDDKTWNGVTLNKSNFDDDGDYHVPSMLSTSATTAKFLKVQQNVSARSIPRRDNNGYIYSTTPSANDNSTKVATTAYVKTAMSSVSTVAAQIIRWDE